MKTELARELEAADYEWRGPFGKEKHRILPPELFDRTLEALRTPAIEDGVLREALEKADIACLGAHMLLEGCATNATGALAEPAWRPNRAHIEGMRNSINKALEEIVEARQALSNPTDAVKPLKEVER